MSATINYASGDPLYIVAQTGVSSWQSTWLDVRGYKAASFTLSWTAVASTNGTLRLDGTDDPAKASVNVVALTTPVFHGTWPTVGTSASAALVVIENPPGFIRVGYTFIAGGAAGQFTGFANWRSI